jgi:dihydrolipoamide dehydrogenase
MQRKVDVAIIGAGSAGLSALRQVKKHTDDYVIIDHSPLGTKCARVGCMPSKALISVAKDYHRSKIFKEEGISGADNLLPNMSSILNHTRRLRDHFTNEMIKVTKILAGDHLIKGQAEITTQNNIRVDDKKITANKIIIATGSRPKIPHDWEKFGNRILTSDNIFEQINLPKRMAVIGLGPIGLELGQAISRFGFDITGFTINHLIARLTDPQVSAESLRIFRQEFPIYMGKAVDIEEKDGMLLIKHPETEFTVDAALIAVGNKPNIEGLGLENLGLKPNEIGTLQFDEQTTQVANLPVFIAGDVNGHLPILHEALDEGFIAGRNSSSSDIQSYCRRTPLSLIFSDPQIAMVGLNYEQINNKMKTFIVGKADFSQQSRAKLEMRNRGLLHIYIKKETAQIIGAELVCPDAEHLAHQLAITIQHQLTVFDMLQIPFYHPTAEEALRTALRDAARQLPDNNRSQGLTLCDSCPEEVIS